MIITYGKGVMANQIRGESGKTNQYILFGRRVQKEPKLIITIIILKI